MKLARKLVAVDFVRFGMVGVAGFFINFALLSLFYRQLQLPIFISQLLASELALSHNFAMHHNWTYKSRRTQKSLWSYIIEFHTTSWVAIVGSSLVVSFFVSVMSYEYLPALVISSFLALFWNFIWTKYYIWNPRRGMEKAEETL